MIAPLASIVGSALVVPGAEAPAATPTPYLVVLARQAAEHGYDKAAEALAKLHATSVERWDGGFDSLERLLRAKKPAQLALVLEPGSIDANLPRALVPILATFDDDPFVDCAWGIVTGADGADALKLVENGRRASERAPPSFTFEFVANPLLERCEAGEVPRTSRDPRELTQRHVALTSEDPKWREVLATERKHAGGCALVAWGPVGDALGLWLFVDRPGVRGARAKAFDPAKVEASESAELPRATPALLLRDVDLAAAVVLGSASHGGVTARALVTPDVAATFDTTSDVKSGAKSGVVRFATIAAPDSFALAAIAHGAAAYIAPLSVAHAARAAFERERIVEGGVSLGEVLRAGYDELVYGGDGRVPSFAPFVEGEPLGDRLDPYSGIVQRVLFGDPAVVVWRDPVGASRRAASSWSDAEQRLDVRLEVDAFDDDPSRWDGWRSKARAASGATDRAFGRVALDHVPAGTPHARVRSAHLGGKDEPRIAAAELTTFVERDAHGAAYLHVLARWPRLPPPAIDPAAVFEGAATRALRIDVEVSWTAVEGGAR